MSMIEDELDEADMVRMYRIMNGHDKVEKTTFWKMAEAREGPGRRRFREKEVCRTIASPQLNRLLLAIPFPRDTTSDQ